MNKVVIAIMMMLIVGCDDLPVRFEICNARVERLAGDPESCTLVAKFADYDTCNWYRQVADCEMTKDGKGFTCIDNIDLPAHRCVK